MLNSCSYRLIISCEDRNIFFSDQLRRPFDLARSFVTMAIDRFDNIAIIGAGPAGLSLAVFLKQHGIGSIVYDSRSANGLPFSGPLSLTPNGLRAADAFGLFERVKSHGSPCRHITTMSNEHKMLKQREIGNADKYGYDALRIYRQAVVDILTDMVDEAGIRIVYEKKFSHVISETDANVTIMFADGEQRTHDLVVGADGIYSTVRRYLFPDVKNSYAGMLAVAALAPTSAVKVPYPEYPLPVGIQGPHGHIILEPLSAHDSVCSIATGYPLPELDRKGWEELEKDRPRLLEILKHQYDKWNPMVQGALDAVQPETLFMWPLYSVPKLGTWKSVKNRVVILGDAAHGLPPTGAFGANLAFEDVYSLGLVMAYANDGQAEWSSCLEWWQEYRQGRVETVKQLMKAMTRQRQQGKRDQDTGQITEQEAGADDSWVFNLDIEKDVRQWIKSL